MLKLLPSSISVGGIALSTMSAVNRIVLKPVLLNPQYDSSPVEVAPEADRLYGHNKAGRILIPSHD